MAFPCLDEKGRQFGQYRETGHYHPQAGYEPGRHPPAGARRKRECRDVAGKGRQNIYTAGTVDQKKLSPRFRILDGQGIRHIRQSLYTMQKSGCGGGLTDASAAYSQG